MEVLTTLKNFLRLDIQSHVDPIAELLRRIEEDTPEVLQQAVNMVKDAVQCEANATITNQNKSYKKGFLAMATGSGKSRIPILQILQNEEPGDILIIVPTQKLRDVGWKEEFKKWGAINHYETRVTTTCYDSLHQHVGKYYRYIIGDEFHNITLDKAASLRSIGFEYFYALSATYPKDSVKQQILKSLGVEITYYLSLDIAVRLRLVAPFKIIIVEVPLNNTDKVIPAGNKKNRFMQTEAAAYKYLDDQIREYPSQMKFIARLKMLKSLDSITKAAKFILENLIPEEERTLIFTGSIDQSLELCENAYFSKPSCKKSDNKLKKERVERQLSLYKGEEPYEKFCSLEINRMSCIDRVNEGNNIPGVDVALATYLNSNDTDFIQRIGRIIRYRIGHSGQFIVLVPAETQAVSWVNSAIQSFSPRNIRRVKFHHLINGTEKLLN